MSLRYCLLTFIAIVSVNVIADNIPSDCGANEAPTWRYKQHHGGAWDVDLDNDERYTYPSQGQFRPQIDVTYTNMVFEQDGDDPYKFTGVQRTAESLTLTSTWALSRPRGTTVTYSCLYGVGVVGVTLHSDDFATEDILYGNPSVAYLYRFPFSERLQPWSVVDVDKLDFGPKPRKGSGEGALTLSLSTHNPLYVDYDGRHRGGNMILSVIMNPREGGNGIAYTIALYKLNERQHLQREGVVQHDPNNGYVHVTGSVFEDARYLTMHRNSAMTQHGVRGTFPYREDPFTDYFNVSLTHDNVKVMLSDICKALNEFCGSSPEDFRVKVVKIQTEPHRRQRSMTATGFSNFRVRW